MDLSALPSEKCQSATTLPLDRRPVDSRALVFWPILFFGIKQLNAFWVLLATDTVLLLVTIVAIYRSKTPWASVTVRTLIWVVFLVAFLFNVVVPLLGGRVVIPAVVVYALLFPYLFWLERLTRRERNRARERHGRPFFCGTRRPLAAGSGQRRLDGSQRVRKDAFPAPETGVRPWEAPASAGASPLR